MKICSVPGCTNQHRAKGYCSKHYRQQWTKKVVWSPSEKRLIEAIITMVREAE